jgi:hypothetical protein
VSVQHQHSAVVSSSCTVLRLLRPAEEGSGPCRLRLDRPQIPGTLRVRSNARAAELGVAAEGEHAPTYVCTLRGVPVADAQACFELSVDTDSLPAAWTVLELTLLSLQGDRSALLLQELAWLPPLPPQQQHDPSVRRSDELPHVSEPGIVGSDIGRVPSRGLKQHKYVSQLEELRLLNERVANAATLDATSVAQDAADCPASLQQLLQKALQQPQSGSSGAVKTLAAAVARGALLQGAPLQNTPGTCSSSSSSHAAGKTATRTAPPPLCEVASTGIQEAGQAAIMAALSLQL